MSASSTSTSSCRELEAHEPPEARGLARDEVRLLVADARDGKLEHARFRELPRLPARRATCSSSTRRRQLPQPLAAPGRTARRSSCGSRRRCRDGRVARRAAPSAPSASAGGARRRAARAARRRPRAELVAPLRRRRAGSGSPSSHLPARARPLPRRARPADPLRLRLAGVAARDLPERLRARAGQRRDAERRAPVHAASWSRALVAKGVLVAPIVAAHRRLLAGARRAALSRVVPRAGGDRRLVNAVHGWGGRVVAVGTTVVRALETVTSPDGTSRPARAGRRS